jgi:hypothetical protein
MSNINIGVIRQRIGRVQSIVSQLPQSLTSATRANIVALTRQQELQKTSIPQSLEDISNKLKEAEVSSNIATELSNFKPFIAQSAVQRRRGTNPRVEGGDSGENRGRSQAKRQIFSPTNGLNNEIANKLRELSKLGLQKNQLSQQADVLEKQIAALSGKLQNLLNIGAGVEQIRQVEAQIEQFTLLYDRTKVTLERIKKLYDGQYRVLEKLRKKRDDLQKKFWNNYDKLMNVIKKFREIPKKLRFPKLPKLPTLNIRKGNIKSKFMDAINKIKQASRDAAKIATVKAKEESLEKIRDPNRGDRFQRAASKARQALRNAQDRVNIVQAQRDAIINATLGQVNNEIQRARIGIDSAQKQVELGIDKAAARSSAQLVKLADAKRRAEQLRDSQLIKLDNFASSLAQQAAAGIRTAQDTLNKELTSADLQSSQNLANRSVDELQKIEDLKNSITTFLNTNNIKNFTTGVGVGSTLRTARQQSLTLDQFSKTYPEAFNQGAYDSTSRIGNVSGVYIVVTTYYQKGNVGVATIGNPTKSI